LLIATVNTTVSTSMSREGKQFYLMRVYPLAAKKQIFAKFLMGYSVVAITIAVMTAIIAVLLPLPPVTILTAMALGFIASVAPTALSLIPDVIKPKLEWNTETEAIKQNMNTLIAMVVGLAYIAAIGFFSYFLLTSKVDAAIVLGIDAAICVLAGVLSLWVLGNAAEKSLIRIEG
jgi:ABC-2 type transport system permease protein